ncbi:MAG: pilin [bacterium]|nr:pilin [bacterium]
MRRLLFLSVLFLLFSATSFFNPSTVLADELREVKFQQIRLVGNPEGMVVTANFLDNNGQPVISSVSESATGCGGAKDNSTCKDGWTVQGSFDNLSRIEVRVSSGSNKPLLPCGAAGCISVIPVSPAQLSQQTLEISPIAYYTVGSSSYSEIKDPSFPGTIRVYPEPISSEMQAVAIVFSANRDTFFRPNDTNYTYSVSKGTYTYAAVHDVTFPVRPVDGSQFVAYIKLQSATADPGQWTIKLQDGSGPNAVRRATANYYVGSEGTAKQGSPQLCTQGTVYSGKPIKVVVINTVKNQTYTVWVDNRTQASDEKANSDGQTLEMEIDSIDESGNKQQPNITRLCLYQGVGFLGVIGIECDSQYHIDVPFSTDNISPENLAELQKTEVVLKNCTTPDSRPGFSGLPFGPQAPISDFFCEPGKTTTSAEFSAEKTVGISTAIGCIPIGIQGGTNQFVAWALRWAIGIAGGVAFLLMLYSGFQIMTASGNPERLQKGRELLTAAISGLILIIFSVFLLRLIGVQILNLPGFGT